MSEAVEVTAAPTIFVTDLESVELVGESVLRYTFIEEVRGERRIVAYVMVPVALVGQMRAHITAALARMRVVETPLIPPSAPVRVGLH